MLAPGDVLGERYRLDERLADGGMSDVWRATDQVLDRVVAVKLLHPSLLGESGFASRFRAEAKMVAALRHPGVVEVYDYGDTTDRPGGAAYLVMAYVDGQPLSTRIAEAGRLGVGETLSVVAQVARALHAAHTAGIVHRDVKPSNLLVEPDGRVVLVDFGVARSAAVSAATGLNEVIGTALYMAPEQVRKQPLSPATDVYALGAVTYHCLAGRPPFTGDSPVQVALRHVDAEPPPLPPDVPEPVRALVRRAMAKDPADRFPDAAAFAAAVEATGLAGAPATAEAPGVAGAPTGGGLAQAAGFAQLVPGAARAPALRPALAADQAPAPRRRVPRHLPAVAVIAVLLGLAILPFLFRSTGYGPAVPNQDRPPTVPSASAGTGTPGAGGGAPGALTPSPGSGTPRSPQATPPASPGAAAPGGQTPGTARTSAPPPSRPPPSSAVPTPLPTSLPSLLPTLPTGIP